MDEQHTPLDTVQDPEKKPYTPPRLTAYGTVQDVTAGVSGGPTDQDGSLPPVE